MDFGKNILLLCILLAFYQHAAAQAGCTDPAAINYNASATTNDGSCVYPVTHNTPLLRAALPHTISESSGIVFTDGKLWTHNDSGNPEDIFSIDTNTGAILQTLTIDNFPNTDWEDIAVDSDYIYIGDFGNDHGTRTDLKILKIKKSDIGAATTVHVNAQAISFSYADQTSFASSNTNNFDCESLIAIRDSLYLFTKDRGDLQTRVYKMSKTPGNYALNPYTTFNVNGLITGADYDPVNKEIILIGYLSGHANSFLWLLNQFNGDLFFSGNKRRIEIGNGQEWQTEGISYISDHHFFISCESAGSIEVSLFVCNNDWTGSALVANYGLKGIRFFPNPVSDLLSVDNTKSDLDYSLFNINGQAIQTGHLSAGSNKIDTHFLQSGIYFFHIEYPGLNPYLHKLIKY